MLRHVALVVAAGVALSPLRGDPWGTIECIYNSVYSGRPLTVVFTDRVDARGVQRRIISARLSNRRERRRYAEILEASRQQEDAE